MSGSETRSAPARSVGQIDVCFHLLNCFENRIILYKYFNYSSAYSSVESDLLESSLLMSHK